MMLKGLFLNPAKANCSIYESGKMIYDNLLLSDKYELSYVEIDENNRSIPVIYDFYVFNYHHVTMGWLDTKSVRHLPGLKLTFILETLPNNPFVLCPVNDFDIFCALDPTMRVSDKRVYAFQRPVEVASNLLPYQESSIPIIGSFGFATPGKGFEFVVDAVNKEFDEAIVRINIPPGTYSDHVTWHLHKQDYADYLTNLCKKTAKKKVEVIVTRDYMSKPQLIQWCGENTLNCFLYNRSQPGLSATTDQAISSGRPLAISTNETFRHLTQYITPYPERSLTESISVSQQEVLKIQQTWSAAKFAKKFDQILEDYKHVIGLGKATEFKTIQLANIPKSSSPNWFQLKTKKIIRFILSPSKVKPMSLPIQPYICHSVKSYSQFNEDLFIDLLFTSKEKGFYMDIGANDPTFNSNTKRFYDKGWSGINVDPDSDFLNKFNISRQRDINLNVGVGTNKGKLIFYQVVGDSTISSFHKEIAEKISVMHKRLIRELNVDVLRLTDIYENYVKDIQIDFMSIDTEGSDLEVLKSNNWDKFRPTVIMVEIDNQYKTITEYMTRNSYFLIFNNSHNAIFLDSNSNESSFKNLLST